MIKLQQRTIQGYAYILITPLLLTIAQFNLIESELKRQQGNSHQEHGSNQSSENPSDNNSRFPIANAIGKTQYKPVGGSGWLNKYTSWKPTQNGYVEYPRIKEPERSPNEITHWYWRYCWRIKGSKIESIGCPQKKVRAVQRAIAANIPYKEIYKFIVADEPAPPTT
ncbi:MAG: hypothetical protein F6K17_01215 [Okeania sp. SIO3C4]|nr:hypothetical protein [Okeania sp. SIO3C4]